MKSPFLGMDPYIEAHGRWRDFHRHLIEKIYEAVAAVLPRHYRIWTEERAFVELVETEGKTSHEFFPDVGVTGSQDHPRTPSAGSTGQAQSAVETEPVALRAFVSEQFREGFIDITLDDPRRRLVTSIEVLSPTNKRRGSKGWKQYLRKREALLLGRANLVEIDLLRRGRKPPMLDAWPVSPYSLLVARTRTAPLCRVWPAHYSSPLPSIPIPLEEPDLDLSLELQPMIEAVYERARYGEDFDYTKPLTPPLAEPDELWLKERLKARAAAP